MDVEWELHVITADTVTLRVIREYRVANATDAVVYAQMELINQLGNAHMIIQWDTRYISLFTDINVYLICIIGAHIC